MVLPGVVTVFVRPGLERDLPAIVELYNHYVVTSPATFELTPVTPQDRRDWMVAHSGVGPHRLLVAEESAGHIVGWATSGPFRPRAAYATTVETSVYCHPAVVGSGVGTALYARLFDEILGQDLARAVAGITLPNPASVALHRRFGFRHVGTFTRVGRKFGRFWDVAWFERPLLGGSEGTTAHGIPGASPTSASGRDGT